MELDFSIGTKFYGFENCEKNFRSNFRHKAETRGFRCSIEKVRNGFNVTLTDASEPFYRGKHKYWEGHHVFPKGFNIESYARCAKRKGFKVSYRKCESWIEAEVSKIANA